MAFKNTITLIKQLTNKVNCDHINWLLYIYIYTSFINILIEKKQ